jgi:hypothetical protein
MVNPPAVEISDETERYVARRDNGRHDKLRLVMPAETWTKVVQMDCQSHIHRVDFFGSCTVFPRIRSGDTPGTRSWQGPVVHPELWLKVVCVEMLSDCLNLEMKAGQIICAVLLGLRPSASGVVRLWI